MNEIINNFRNKLKNGETVLGPFSRSCDPAFVEICGYSGFDFIILDIEHGPNNIYTLQNLIRGAQVANIAPIVRVSNVNEEIFHALDIGAAGIQVPQITTAEQAKEVIKFANFQPDGYRGVCRFVRSAKYSSINKLGYFKSANENIVILQIEGKEGLDNIESIINVKGIDILFIGPYDLSQSLGLLGQVEHPLVERRMKEIIEICNKIGVITGTFCDTIENAKKWQSAGIQYVSYSTDVGIFYETCSERVSKIRNKS